MVSIGSVITGLRAIPDERFVCDYVYEYLSDNPIATDSIEKYCFWSPKYYTRNLIYKDDRFEAMAVCWEPGHESQVHNHWDQMCWMTVPVGRLQGQNFAVETIDEAESHCKLRETDRFELSDCLTAKVELEQPIHQIRNVREYNSQAVSIHIYSKPYDRCLAYCLDTNTYKVVRLFYTSIDGKLCDGIEL